MLLNLALVTETLVSLITKYAQQSPLASQFASPPLVVTSQPPDQLKLKGDHVIGIYLYHLREDAQYKNLPSPYADEPPVRFTPMGLNLYYQLTAHSDVDGPNGVAKEQLLIGVAIKALRDYPIIDDITEIAGQPVLPAELQNTGNRFRLVLEPVEAGSAMTYWTAGNQALRLALYYQVSVVLLEPAQPSLLARRVLTYGVFGSVRGSPRLEGSRSTVSFVTPDGVAHDLEVRPAEAPVNGPLTFFGSGLSGDQTTLLLRNRRFDDAVEVGADWGVVASESEVSARVQSTAGGLDVLPGMYSAAVKVIERRVVPGDSPRDFTKTSNEAPFIVSPRIDGIALDAVSQTFTVSGGVFQHTDLPPSAVEVYAGAARVPEETGAAVTPGKFRIVSASALEVRFPVASLMTGETVPLRLIVNGAENAPTWVTVP